MKLKDILEAAQAAGTEGKAPTPEQRREAIKAKFAEVTDRDVVLGLQKEAAEGFDNLDAGNPTDPTEIFGMHLLADVAEVSIERIGEFDAADKELADQREKLRERMKSVKPADDKATEDDKAKADDKASDAPEGDKPAEGDKTVEATATTAEAPAADAPAAPAEAAPAADAAPAPAMAAAASPIGHFSIANVTARPAPVVKEADRAEAEKPAPRALIAAGAHLNDYSVGQELNGMEGLTAAAVQAFEQLPANGTAPDKTLLTNRLATIRLPYGDGLTATDKDDTEVIGRAVDQSRLSGGSLVAAGGWCAPSETLYDLAPLLADAGAGLVDVPDIAVRRGGIRTTEGANFRTIYGGNVGTFQTEAQAEAGTEKVIYRVPCTDFVEKRADVIYTGVEAGILQNDAYPELTRQHVEGALAVHAHKMNASTISRMFALATEVDLMGDIGPSAAGSLLNGLEMQVMDYRYGYRANERLILEGIAPIWLRTVIRSDLALRTGVDFVAVTDAQIDKFFLDRGVRMQWVYDWQDAYTGVAAGFGAASAIESFPNDVYVLLYAAGTFVRGRGEVISLDAVYDSVNIRENDFLVMFVEEKLLVHKRQYSARRIKFPLAVSGTTGGAVFLDGDGKPQPLPLAAP